MIETEEKHLARLKSKKRKIPSRTKKAEKRGSLRGMIKVSIGGMVQNDFFFSIAQNISTSGILFETEKLLEQGDKITCSFILQHRISVAAQVVRAVRKSSDVYHYGVRFLDLTPKAKAQIEELVKGQR